MDAASWLNTHAGKQAVLVEPGAPFGQYLWGSPMDDVLQALTDTDYAERNLAAVGSAGNERLLNAIDQQLAAGDGSAGLTQVLARMGVKYVLVRNDLSRPVLNGTWPARISDALAASPGITPVAQFGPLVSGLAPDDAAADFDAPYPAVRDLPGGRRAAGRGGPVRREHAAGLRRPGIADHAGRPGPARQQARSWSTTTARTSRSRARW